MQIVIAHSTAWRIGSVGRALDCRAGFVFVYHFHGQTGRSTVWANGTQNSGLVNLVPESRLPFVQ